MNHPIKDFIEHGKGGKQMTERYWELDDIPDTLADFISDTVEGAVRHFWEIDAPMMWVSARASRINGATILTIAGPPKPTKSDPSGGSDNYTVDVDLLYVIREFVDIYSDIGGPKSKEQANDMQERYKTLAKLANDILGLLPKGLT